MTDAKEQTGSEPSGTRPVESNEVSGSEFGSGPKPSSYADTQPGTDYRGTAIPTGALLAGRYRIDHFIARGGMGEVYAAHDCVLNDRIALKTVTGTSSGDMGALAALRAEVTLSRKISHPNVCRMHDIGVHVSQVAPQLTFLTMEYIDGESLGARVTREGAIPEAEAARMLAAILRGLQAAHEAGVLHRDLKSDNVMLRLRPNAEPVPVIMDFGLASALSPNSSRVSSEQAMVGSLAYMAPEQVQGDALRVATDIYSVGVIFFEMLTGQLPFKASSPALAALKRLHEPAPRVRSIDPRISPVLDRILAKALEHRPQDRYQSARAMLRDVLEYLEHGDEAELGERPGSVNPGLVDADFGSERDPARESGPAPDFSADETTLVTGRSYSPGRSTPISNKSEPPGSLDNSLPVLAATPAPVTSLRPRRIAGLLMVAVAASGLVALLVGAPFGQRGEQPPATAAPVTLGIGVPNAPSGTSGAMLRPGVNNTVSQHAPTELVTSPFITSPSIGTTVSGSTAPPVGSSVGPELGSATVSPAAKPPTAGLLRPPSPPPSIKRPSPAPAEAAGVVAAAPSASAPPASRVSQASSVSQPSVSQSGSVSEAVSVPRSSNSAGLVYPPGVKKPVLLQPAVTPDVH